MIIINKLILQICNNHTTKASGLLILIDGPNIQTCHQVLSNSTVILKPDLIYSETAPGVCGHLRPFWRNELKFDWTTKLNWDSVSK